MKRRNDRQEREGLGARRADSKEPQVTSAEQTTEVPRFGGAYVHRVSLSLSEKEGERHEEREGEREGW